MADAPWGVRHFFVCLFGREMEKAYFCSMNELYRKMKQLLVEGGMEAGEAQAVALLMLEKKWGLTVAEVLSGGGKGRGRRAAMTSQQTEQEEEEKEKEKEEEEEEEMLALVRRVAGGEPVQYVLGEAEFCGMELKVRPGVLIPRPETEELVAWAVEEGKRFADNLTEGKNWSRLRMLDIGTGSGCIALALARLLAGADVEAWDVSEEALEVARENGERMGVQVRWRRMDVLDKLEAPSPFSLIVSNPPYICEEEKGEMEAHVLEHEPELALFVPNEDPLRFYRRIAELGMEGLLASGGALLFEVNRRFGQQVVTMLEGMGYEEVELRKDFFGNDRMVKAIKRGNFSL